MDVEQQHEQQCTVCGEQIEADSNPTTWLCPDCEASWERERESVW